MQLAETRNEGAFGYGMPRGGVRIPAFERMQPVPFATFLRYLGEQSVAVDPKSNQGHERNLDDEGVVATTQPDPDR
jgi:hypothetical protein